MRPKAQSFAFLKVWAALRFCPLGAACHFVDKAALFAYLGIIIIRLCLCLRLCLIHGLPESLLAV